MQRKPLCLVPNIRGMHDILGWTECEHCVHVTVIRMWLGHRIPCALQDTYTEVAWTDEALSLSFDVLALIAVAIHGDEWLTHISCSPFSSASAVASSPGHSSLVGEYTTLDSLYSFMWSSSPLVYKDIVICLYACSVWCGQCFAILGKEELFSWLALPGLLC